MKSRATGSQGGGGVHEVEQRACHKTTQKPGKHLPPDAVDVIVKIAKGNNNNKKKQSATASVEKEDAAYPEPNITPARVTSTEHVSRKVSKLL